MLLLGGAEAGELGVYTQIHLASKPTSPLAHCAQLLLSRELHDSQHLQHWAKRGQRTSNICTMTIHRLTVIPHQGTELEELPSNITSTKEASKD